MKQRRLKIISILLLSLATSILADEPAEEKKLESKLEAKIVIVSANAGISGEENHLKRLFNNSSKPGINLTYLVKAKNIIQIAEKSFFIKSKNYEGWKCGSFPRISEDANAASFFIEKQGKLLGKIDQTQIEGTTDDQTGTALISKSLTLMNFDEPLHIDDFLYNLLEGKLKIEAQHKLIKDITVEQHDKELSTFGSGWSNNTRAYNYKGIAKGAKISFSYWDGVVPRKVHFSKK